MKSQIIVLLSLFLVSQGSFSTVSKPEWTEPCRSLWWEIATKEKVQKIKNVDQECHHGGRIIHMAVTAYNVRLAAVNELLLMGAQLNVKHEGGWTPLHQLAFQLDKRFDLIDLLLRFGADVNAVDDVNSTPLHFVFARGQADLPAVASMLRHGAEVNAKNTYLQTPLHRAVIHQENPAVIKLLLDAGADVHAKDQAGRSPLELAHIYAPQEIIDLLERVAG